MKKVLATIKIALQNKVLSVYINGNKNIILFLKVLEKEGIIRGFQILNFTTYRICIFLSYKENMTAFVKDLKSVSETKERYYLKHKTLASQKLDMNLHFISTKLGLLKLNDLNEQAKCLKYKIGGEYKYRIEFNKMYETYKELSKK